MAWGPVVAFRLLLLLSAACLGRAADVYVSQGGSCTPSAPRGAACASLPAALRNSSATRIVLLEDVQCLQEDWSNNGRANGESPYGYVLGRDLEITALDGKAALNLMFISDAVVLAPNVTLTFTRMEIKNARRGAGLGIDFFVGSAGSRIVLSDVVRWRYACTDAAEAMRSHMSYPRAPGVPGVQNVTVRNSFCWRSECYGNDTLFYVDMAVVVMPAMTESAAYLPGYTIIIRDVVRVCETILPESCLLQYTRDQCLLMYSDAYIQTLMGHDHSKSIVIAAVATVLGAAAIAAPTVAFFWVRRRRRLRRALEDESASKMLARFGPIEDVAMANKLHGWRVTHHARAPQFTPPTGGDGLAASGSGGGLSPLLGSRIELGVLLGAGSFGRVYKGRWQGKDVAVKVMQHDARTANKVANEVELMMMMQHANILKAYDVITWTHTSQSDTKHAKTEEHHARDVRASSVGRHTASDGAGPHSHSHAQAGPPATPAQSPSAGGGGGLAAQRRASLDSLGGGECRSGSSTLASSMQAGSARANGAATPASHSGAWPLLGALGGARAGGGGGGGAGAKPDAKGAQAAAGSPKGWPHRLQQQAQQTLSEPLHTVAAPAAATIETADAAAGAVNGPRAQGLFEVPPLDPPPEQAAPDAPPRAASLARRSAPGGWGGGDARGGGNGGNGGGGAGVSYVPVVSLSGDGASLVITDSGPVISDTGAALCSSDAAPAQPPAPGGTPLAAPLGGPAAGGSGGALGSAPAVLRDLTGSGDGFGSGETNTEAQTWLIVEFCDAGTLADAVRAGKTGPRGSPDMAKILVRLRDVAAGMAYLHSRNVLHGDLKAANVLLCTNTAAPFGMVAKVADFGLSRMLKVGQTHRSTRTVGTVTHMPPELLRLGKLSPAGDVYAFGMIMWEVFTGQAAFEKQHYGEVFERVVLRDERPPVPPHMPEAYALLMTRCWVADPLSRPGFDTVLRLIQLMIDDALGPGASEGAAGGGSGAGGSGGAAGGGRGGGADGSGAARSGGGGNAGGAAAASSNFFQDL